MKLKNLQWWMKELEAHERCGARYLSTAINTGWMTNGTLLVQLTEDQQAEFKKTYGRRKSVQEQRPLPCESLLPQHGCTLGKALTEGKHYPALPMPKGRAGDMLVPFVVLHHPDGTHAYVDEFYFATLTAWHKNCQWHATWDKHDWRRSPIYFAGRRTVGALMPLDPDLYAKVA